MTSTPDSIHDRLPTPVRAALGEAEVRLRAAPSYQRAWQRVFTSEERDQIGDLVAYCREHRCDLIQVFMQLRNLSQYRATIELAFALNHLSAADREWLLRETNETPIATPDETAATNEARPTPKPFWDRSSYTLWFNGAVARRVKKPNTATNIIAILEAFYEEGSPTRIDDPIPGGRDPVRLAAAIKSLNRTLNAIKFGKDGTGEGVVWRVE